MFLNLLPNYFVVNWNKLHRWAYGILSVSVLTMTLKHISLAWWIIISITVAFKLVKHQKLPVRISTSPTSLTGWLGLGRGTDGNALNHSEKPPGRWGLSRGVWITHPCEGWADVLVALFVPFTLYLRWNCRGKKPDRWKMPESDSLKSCLASP